MVSVNVSLGSFGQRKSLLIIYAKLFLNTIINGKSQTLLSDFFEVRGGCTQASNKLSNNATQNRLLITSVKIDIFTKSLEVTVHNF